MDADDALRYNQYWDDVAKGLYNNPYGGKLSLDEISRMQCGFDKIAQKNWEYELGLDRYNNRILDYHNENPINNAIKGVSKADRLIPGNIGVVIGGDSTKLGKNIMESMGLKRSTKWTGHQAQHIIPAEMADNPILQKIGMNLDDASNGILLRTPDADLSAMSRHRGYHSVYNDVVKRQLNNMDVNQSVEVLQKQVFDLQSDLRKLQESGLPLYPSQGATVDLWERSLNRIRK